MTRFILTTALIAGFAMPAFAQEQQVYSPYAMSNSGGDYNGSALAQQYGTVQQQAPNTYRVYPGRENYGENFGYMTRHPGDYRDAVDRGQWEGGGGYRMPRRSRSGY